MRLSARYKGGSEDYAQERFQCVGVSVCKVIFLSLLYLENYRSDRAEILYASSMVKYPTAVFLKSWIPVSSLEISGF